MKQGPTDTETIDKILVVVRSVLGDAADLATSMANTPAWDSLKALQIIMGLDEAGVYIPFERIPEIKSVADMLKIAEG